MQICDHDHGTWVRLFIEDSFNFIFVFLLNILVGFIKNFPNRQFMVNFDGKKQFNEIEYVFDTLVHHLSFSSSITDVTTVTAKYSSNGTTRRRAVFSQLQVNVTDLKVCFILLWYHFDCVNNQFLREMIRLNFYF